jgi:hypothetical protein
MFRNLIVIVVLGCAPAALEAQGVTVEFGYVTGNQYREMAEPAFDRGGHTRRRNVMT